MKVLSFIPLAVLPALASSMQFETTNTSTTTTRPHIHFTPPSGWMNDPNGLFYDQLNEIYHVYYQYNPNDTIWGKPLYWGHATSKDLLTFEHHEPAIAPDSDDAGIYSGSIVVDRNNTSGFFDDADDVDPEQRIVAIYTLDVNETEAQEVAYSLDGGYTFEKYEGNPVLDLNSSQFRDPKVIWHEDSQKWIMVVAKAQEYKIQIYKSSNLTSWELASNVSHAGLLGYQYECPGLFKAQVSNPQDSEITEKWVLMLAINPGSALGGSFNQYFIGDFDGEEFVAMDSAMRVLDSGKDFYAFQSFDNVPDNKILGLAWASNWQYAARVPDQDGYRSSMSLVREYSLKYVSTNPESKDLVLVQNPVVDEDGLTVLDEFEVEDFSLDKHHGLETFYYNSTGLMDFNMTFTLEDPSSLGYRNISTFEIQIKSDQSDEMIKIGYDGVVTQYYVNRHTDHEFQNDPFFNEKWSTYVQPNNISESGAMTYQIYGIIDVNIMELYFDDNAFTSTNTFFFKEGVPSNLVVTCEAKESFITINSLKVRYLSV